MIGKRLDFHIEFHCKNRYVARIVDLPSRVHMCNCIRSLRLYCMILFRFFMWETQEESLCLTVIPTSISFASSMIRFTVSATETKCTYTMITLIIRGTNASTIVLTRFKEITYFNGKITIRTDSPWIPTNHWSNARWRC